MRTHKARARRAALFGLPASTRATPRALTASQRGLVVATRRILAILGPPPLAELPAALRRRQRRDAPLLTTAAARAVLNLSPAVEIDARMVCRLTSPAEPARFDVALVDAARRSGRTLPANSEIRQALHEAGYRGTDPVLAYHPM